MDVGSVELRCPSCNSVCISSDLGASYWNCRCGSSYYLRRCAECQAVSHVRYIQRDGEPWTCMWCRAANNGYLQHGDPAAAVLGDLAADMATKYLEYPGLGVRPPMLAVTTNEIPGYRIVRVHGDVLGLTVRAFSSFGVRLQTVALGEAPGLAGRLLGSYNQARSRMWEEACSRGANAVVGVRLASTEVGEGITEVIAHGTAVTVEPAETQPPRSQLT